MTELLSAIIYCSGWIVEQADYLDILDSDTGKGLFLQKDRGYQLKCAQDYPRPSVIIEEFDKVFNSWMI